MKKRAKGFSVPLNMSCEYLCYASLLSGGSRLLKHFFLNDQFLLIVLTQTDSAVKICPN